MSGGSPPGGPGEADRLLRLLEADPSVEDEAQALDEAVLARLASGVRRRTGPAARLAPVLRVGALAFCAVLGLWVGWTTQLAAPAPTLLASVQISPIADPP